MPPCVDGSSGILRRYATTYGGTQPPQLAPRAAQMLAHRPSTKALRRWTQFSTMLEIAHG
eukprot:scaffold1221_cov207-Amphora_coffeaeformis.AAC.28